MSFQTQRPPTSHSALSLRRPLIGSVVEAFRAKFSVTRINDGLKDILVRSNGRLSGLSLNFTVKDVSSDPKGPMELDKQTARVRNALKCKMANAGYGTAAQLVLWLRMRSSVRNQIRLPIVQVSANGSGVARMPTDHTAVGASVGPSM